MPSQQCEQPLSWQQYQPLLSPCVMLLCLPWQDTGDKSPLPILLLPIFTSTPISPLHYPFGFFVHPLVKLSKEMHGFVCWKHFSQQYPCQVMWT